MDRLGWQVQIVRKLTGGVMFDRVMAEPTGSGERASLRMTAYNPLSSDLKRAVFVIQAIDNRDELIGRWRVEWTQPIGARQRVELSAATPLLKTQAAVSWQVVAAGEPFIVAPAVPAVDPQQDPAAEPAEVP